MKKVLVVHPGLQHSHQLALACYESNMLLKYISGVPVRARGEKIPFYIPQRLATRIKTVDIPFRFREHPIWPQVLMRLLGLLPNFIKNDELNHWVFHLYDWFISRKVKYLKPDVVVAFENSAYHTFKEAKKIGAKCVLDAPAIHWKLAGSLIDIPHTKFRNKINRNKDREIELADLILTCSPIARNSYISNGVDEKKVKSILLGASLPDFKFELKDHDNPLTFVFAGVMRKLKSIDEILAACVRLEEKNKKFKVVFVGACDDNSYLNKINNISACNYLGKKSQSELFDVFTNSDCLLLPSKFDSFGMVVAEAMACGIPAIVSTMTGSKAIIEQYQNSGWIIEPNEDAIYSTMLYCIENRSVVFKSGQIAKQASKIFTWAKYHDQVINIIND